VASTDSEEKQLRIAALRNAEEIMLARNRAEQELRDAKLALETSNRELQQQHELFQVTLSSIGDAVITTDADAIITFLNPIAEQMTGWSTQDAVGQPLNTIFRIVNELTLEPVVSPIDRALAVGGIVGLANHTSLIGRHGNVTSIEDSAAPIRDTTGRVVGAVMVFHDVTARRRTEAALNESELRLRTVFNQAAVGIAVTDLAGTFLQVNHKFVEVFGYSTEELHELTFLQLTHPHDLATTKQCLRQLVSGELSDAVLEKRCIRKDGGVIWSLNTITVVTDADAKPQHLIGIVEDITARKSAEEAQARLVAVIASSDDSIISMTLEGTVTTWNRGAERMYGYDAAEMIGQTTAALIPLDRQDEEPEILDRIRRGERIEHFETIRRRKDGARLDVSIAVSPIEDLRGTIIGASKITRDITQAKRTEAALIDMDRRKDEFLATLAHELRNPLAPIRQAALIAKSDSATEAQKRWSHEVISRQVQHMSLLLDDLLDISRITRGTLGLRLEMTDLTDVVDAAVETARPIVDAKRHLLSVRKPPEPVRLLADPVRLAQVLSNLLTNAAKYTDPEGAIEVRFAVAGDDALIAVKDSGIGIAADKVSQVFEMFAQVKSTHDRTEGGLGIGLALSKGLVELHGGMIEARSAGLGRGSEFSVRLPRREARADAGAVKTAAALADGVSRRVLIADDNRDAAESLALLLKLDGHDVRVVHDGEAAVSSFSDFRPEVALVDIGMPGLNGYEVARTVRKGSLGRAVTLIAVTGWGQDRDKAQALAAGFNHHFTKPVEPGRINEILRSLVNP
jgi:PAS domain S-box-containing protein